jgi:hypothetical protein
MGILIRAVALPLLLAVVVQVAAAMKDLEDLKIFNNHVIIVL